MGVIIPKSQVKNGAIREGFAMLKKSVGYRRSSPVETQICEGFSAVTFADSRERGEFLFC
jgi:hypothetical protein